MGKKKKRKIEPEGPQAWCFYCDRTFTDEAILVQHQKARHFKCTCCSKRFTNSNALTIHLSQVHKITLEKVPHAMEGRESVSYEVSGLRGLPYDHEAVIDRIKKDPMLRVAGMGAYAAAAISSTTTVDSSAVGSSFLNGGIQISYQAAPQHSFQPQLASQIYQTVVPTIDIQQQVVQPVVSQPSLKKSEEVKDFGKNPMLNIDGLIYKFEKVSPEERRASLEKYKFDENKIKQKLQNLDSDIGARLSKFLS